MNQYKKPRIWAEHENEENMDFFARMIRFYANEPIHLASLILSITAIIISCLVFAKG